MILTCFDSTLNELDHSVVELKPQHNWLYTNQFDSVRIENLGSCTIYSFLCVFDSKSIDGSIKSDGVAIDPCQNFFLLTTRNDLVTEFFLLKIIVASTQ